MKNVSLNEKKLNKLVSETVSKILKEEVSREEQQQCDRIVSKFNAMQALDLVEQILGKRERDMIYYALLDKYNQMW